MAEENKEIKKVNIETASDKEIDSLIEQTAGEPKEGEPKVELISGNEPEEKAEETDKTFEFEIVEKGKEGEPSPAEPAKPEPKPEEKPKPDEPTKEEIAFKALQEAVPEYAKFKTLAELNEALKQPQAEPKPEPKPEPIYQTTTEQEQAIIDDQTLKVAQADPVIGRLLATAETTVLPSTEEGWGELYEKKPFAYHQIVDRMRAIKQGVTAEFTQVKQAFESKPKHDADEQQKFVQDISDLVQKVYKDIANDAVTLKEVEDTIAKYQDKLKDPKYYVMKNGVQFFDRNLMKADFINENATLLTKLAGLNSNKEVAERVKKELESKTKTTSQTTLGSAGLTRPKNKIINLKNPEHIEELDDKKIDIFLKELEKEK